MVEHLPHKQYVVDLNPSEQLLFSLKRELHVFRLVVLPCLMNSKIKLHTVHPESFRSNAQIAIAFARRNRPRVDRNDEFECVYLRSRAFASTVRDRPRARTYIGMVWALHYLH